MGSGTGAILHVWAPKTDGMSVDDGWVGEAAIGLFKMRLALSSPGFGTCFNFLRPCRPPPFFVPL